MFGFSRSQIMQLELGDYKACMDFIRKYNER